MLGAMQEIMSIGNEDYEEWKEFLNDEMLSTLKLIPKTYDYEIERAKRGGK